MSAPIDLEPNPAPGRMLTQGFFDRSAAYQETVAAFARESRLLPPEPGRPRFLPYIDPPDLVVLPAVRAVGAHGFPIVAGLDAEAPPIKPFDCGSLPVGRHRIYACLAREKVPSGPFAEEDESEDGTPRLKAREFRRMRVLLALEDGRLEHRDWIQVAEIERAREGGAVRTFLDESFHPVIRSMAAYALPNPLPLLAGQGLAALDRAGDPAGTDSLRVELNLLRNVSEAATAEAALLQAQRCISLLRARPDLPIVVDGALEAYRFRPETFCRFLADLARSLSRSSQGERYPTLLEIDGLAYTRLPGELVEDEDGWTWRPTQGGFVANGLAIYLPSAVASELPHIRYATQKLSAGRYRLATFERRLSAPGAAAVLEGMPAGSERLFVSADSVTQLQKLRQKLGDGHALYYR